MKPNLKTLISKPFRPKYSSPFGMVMPEREYTVGVYKFGFNGKERDIEKLKQAHAFEFRIYNTLLGRWYSGEPNQARFPGISTYAFCINNPIYFHDGNGKDIVVPINSHKQELMKNLIYAFGMKTIRDFAFEGDKLIFTGCLDEYAADEQILLTNLLSVIDNHSRILSVYYQTDFLSTDIAKIRSAGENATGTESTGGEALIPKDKTKNDYSTANLYIDPNGPTPMAIGVVVKNYYVGRNGGLVKERADAKMEGGVAVLSNTTYTEPLYIYISTYSNTFHGIGHFIGEMDKSKAIDLENAANAIHKTAKLSFSGTNWDQISINKKRNGDYRIKNRPLSTRDYDDEHQKPTVSEPIKGHPLKTLTDVWD